MASTFAGQAGDAFDRIQAAISGVSAPLGEIGMKLFWSLVLISFLWHTLRWILARGDVTEVFSGILRTIFLLGFAFWLMPAGEQPNRVVDFVVSFSADVTKAIAGASGLRGIVVAAITSYGNHLSAIFNLLTSSSGDSHWWTSLSNFFSSLPSTFILLLAATVLVLAAAITFLSAIAGAVLLQVATVLSPIFIPWLVLPITTWVFDGWLRFLVTAALYQIVAAVLLRVGNQVIASIIPTTPPTNLSDWGATLGASLIVLLVALAAAWMAMSVSSVAAALVSGGGVNSGGLRGAAGVGARALINKFSKP